MKMFNKYEAINEVGQTFANLLNEAIAPIIQGAINACGNTREVEIIALEEVGQICAEIRIRRAIAKDEAK